MLFDRRPEANWLHIVMSLVDIFAHIFSETRRIWTKLGKEMGMEKEWRYKIFGEIVQGAPEKGPNSTNTSLFLAGLLVCSLPFCRFPRNLGGVLKSLCEWSTAAKFWQFSVKRSLFPKTDFGTRFCKLCSSSGVNKSKTVRHRKKKSLILSRTASARSSSVTASL